MSDAEQKIFEQFGRLKPPVFCKAESEDAHDLIDRCQRILRTTNILDTSEISFTTFQLTRTAYRWWQAYKLSRLADTAPLTWHEFSALFLEKFVPHTHIEELRRQFEQLRQEDITVTHYEMRFSELACHAVWLVPTEREKIRRFIDGLNYRLPFITTGVSDELETHT
ncbi:uncharacterized protein [Nicotiana tomentosiformis]|uniref:uncharacterized protein n=1 Tax=Nicotiana tomentosiformis TaxID=4098 RepID=UPI00388C3C4F